MTDGPYRDADAGLRQERDALAAERWEELTKTSSLVWSIYALRAARRSAGAAGLLAVPLLVLAAAYGAGGYVLPATWLAVVVVWLVALAAAPRLLRRELVEHYRMTDDPLADVERLRQPVAHQVRARADRLERSSVALPLMALAMLAPLTLHLLIAAPFTGLRAFNAWIVLSLIIVGHVHLVLAWQAWKFARTLRATRLDELSVPRRDGWRALWITFGWSFFPGSILLLIPPIVVLMTGLLVIPFTWASMQRRVWTERRLLT